jgi:N-lysine methyltransferase SETD6
MIYESAQGDASSWSQYLHIIPDGIDNSLINWSEEELKELQGSAVIDKIGKEEVEQAIKDSLYPLMVANANLFGVYSEYLRGQASEQFVSTIAHKMSGLAMALAFDLEEIEDDAVSNVSADEDDITRRGLVPLADMLNFSPSAVNVGHHFTVCTSH